MIWLTLPHSGWLYCTSTLVGICHKLETSRRCSVQLLLPHKLTLEEMTGKNQTFYLQLKKVSSPRQGVRNPSLQEVSINSKVIFVQLLYSYGYKISPLFYICILSYKKGGNLYRYRNDIVIVNYFGHDNRVVKIQIVTAPIYNSKCILQLQHLFFIYF